MEDFLKELKDDLLDFSVILQTTSNDATLFLQEVGRVYNFIGQKFPVIEEEIVRENKNAMGVIDYFLKKEGDDKKDTFYDNLKINQDKFLYSLKNMQAFIDLDTDLSNAIVAGVSKVDNIMLAIDKIKVLADQIKIYSLNAVVTSSKYGSAGRAFGEISKNIIKLSDSSNQSAESMSQVGKMLFDKFFEFKTEIIDVNTQQQNAFEKIEKDITVSFERVLDTFNTFSQILIDVIERVDSTKVKIFDVMTSLQREDIVRQQTEHIISSIAVVVNENKKFIEEFSLYQEIKNTEAMSKERQEELVETVVEQIDKKQEIEELISNVLDDDKEDNTIENKNIAIRELKMKEEDLRMKHMLLDLFTFNDVVLNLIMHNFDTIYKEIIEVNNKLKDALNYIKKSITDIADDKGLILDFFVGEYSGHAFNILHSVFIDYIANMRGYIENVNTFLLHKENIAQKNEDISDIIDLLENMFNNVKSIAKTFNSINFLAKIELEKNAEIFSDSQAFSVQNVESVASNITKTVEQCLKEFDAIENDLFASLDVFRNNIRNQKGEYMLIENSTEDISRNLEDSKNIIKNNVKTLDGYSDDLITLVDETLNNMKELDALLEEISGITNIYRDIVDKMKSKKAAIYKNYGISAWKIENQKFTDILDTYTIRGERAIADAVLSGDDSVDIEIDVGAHSGEFTLF